MVVTHPLWEWPVHWLLLWVAGIFSTMKICLIVCTCKCVWAISTECFQCLLNAYFLDIHGTLFRVEEFNVFLNFNSNLTLPCEPCDGQLEYFFQDAYNVGSLLMKNEQKKSKQPDGNTKHGSYRRRYYYKPPDPKTLLNQYRKMSFEVKDFVSYGHTVCLLGLVGTRPFIMVCMSAYKLCYFFLHLLHLILALTLPHPKPLPSRRSILSMEMWYSGNPSFKNYPKNPAPLVLKEGCYFVRGSFT